MLSNLIIKQNLCVTFKSQSFYHLYCYFFAGGRGRVVVFSHLHRFVQSSLIHFYLFLHLFVDSRPLSSEVWWHHIMNTAICCPIILCFYLDFFCVALLSVVKHGLGATALDQVQTLLGSCGPQHSQPHGLALLHGGKSHLSKVAIDLCQFSE